MKTVQFFFDPISPYVYLAWTQIPKIQQETGATFQFVPILFAGLLKAHGQKGPAEIPSKRIYTAIDITRWAEHYRVPIEGPPGHPFNPLLCQRMLCAVSNDADRARLAGVFIEACWAKGEDLSNPEALLRLVRSVGSVRSNGSKLLAQAETQVMKDIFRKNTEDAIAHGVFGVPTFIVDDQLFWGNDRLTFLADYLKTGKKPNAHTVTTVLDRPRFADRKNLT